MRITKNLKNKNLKKIGNWPDTQIVKTLVSEGREVLVENHGRF